MNPVLFFLIFPPSVAPTGLLQQARSGLSWGWILLILLILALVILWWLLGPGAKRRRRRMADLPKPAQASPAQAPKPAAPAGLPVSQAAPPPVETTPVVAQATESVAEPAAEIEQPAPEEALPTIPEAEEEKIVEAVDVAEADIPLADEEAEANEVAAPVEPDNLRKIEGIGPKVAGILIANGIPTFAQLAETPVEQLMEILEAEGLKFMKPDTWPEQAAFAAKGDWGGLAALQDQLKGGRRIEE